MRPIFSPTDFIQIKGRGTRKYTFTYKDANNEEKKEKEKFMLFDFFANYEYFEEKYNYDQVLKLPIKAGTGVGGGEGMVMEEVTIYNPDPLKTFSVKAVGLAGMKIDWKFFEKFENTIKNDPIVKQKYDEGDLEGAEEYVKNEIFEKPEDYFNLDKLRKAVKSRPPHNAQRIY
jgi:type I restriction enzyme R subunit